VSPKLRHQCLKLSGGGHTNRLQILKFSIDSLACLQILKACVYEDRLRQLDLWSLKERRNRADIIELFKLLKGISATP